MPPTDSEGLGVAVASGLDGERLLARYRTMARIRAFEERVAVRFREGDIPGFVHTSLGQEAVAMGACATLRREDVVTTTHRGHGHSLAKGVDPVGMMAELFGRATGVCRGKGGSMHIADPGAGVLGASGIVGAGIPLAVGATLSAATLETGMVSLAFFGEGAVQCGAFHEGVTLAVHWSVPTVLVCENNLYSEFTDSRSIPGPSPAERGAAYGLPAEVVDGNDVLAVEDAVARAVRGARAGAGPAFVKATTYRFSGHYEGDPETVGR